MSTKAYNLPPMDVELYHQWLNERSQPREKTEASLFVTISREYGCDGYPVALRLSEMLTEREKASWMVFSRPTIEKLVEDEELSVSMIHDISEKRYAFMDWFIDGLVPDYLQSPQSMAFERMRTLIMNVIEKGNCIILGGAAQILSKDLNPKKFASTHIRLVGTEESRVKGVMNKFELLREEAEKHLKKNQGLRDKFVEDFTGFKATDPYLYHLILNAGRHNTEILAQTIFSYMDCRGLLK